MTGNHDSKLRSFAQPRLAGLALLSALVLLWSSTAVAAASSGPHGRDHRGPATCLLPGGKKSSAEPHCARHAIVDWPYWCRHHVHCAARHLYLKPHFWISGTSGRLIKTLPEGRWGRRFAAAGTHHHVSPRILMAIGLIESYGGTTSTAYMGCLRDGTYNSWPKQISCATKVITAYGLAGYNPANPSYPAIIRQHAKEIVLHSH
jgi:hypothetical protein